MMTWDELKAEFEALEAEMPDAFISLSWGGGESYFMHLDGVESRKFRDRFMNLAYIGGRMIQTQFSGILAPPGDSEWPSRRWFETLRNVLNRFGGFGFSEGLDGMRFHGEIPYVVAASVDLCVRAKAMQPLSTGAPASTGSVSIAVHGDHSRAYFQSPDSSVNLESLAPDELVKQLINVIERTIPESERGALVDASRRLQETAKTPSFMARYKEWLDLANAHISILQPFIGPLSQLIP